jgi:hypothetical protein
MPWGKSRPARYIKPGPGQKSVWDYPRPQGSCVLLSQSRGYLLCCGERVQTQEGDFYGGWITSAIVGPFKGGPDTWDW